MRAIRQHRASGAIAVAALALIMVGTDAPPSETDASGAAPVLRTRAVQAIPASSSPPPSRMGSR